VITLDRRRDHLRPQRRRKMLVTVSGLLMAAAALC